MSLNPCFNGRYSLSILRQRNLELPFTICLNPCFNGRYSLRATGEANDDIDYVLILVLMEDTL